MTSDAARAQLDRLATDEPMIYQDAWRWFVEQGPAVAPTLVDGLSQPALGGVCHWRILLVLRELRLPSTLPAILTAFDAALAADNPIVLPGALEALAVFDDEAAWAALIRALGADDTDTVNHAAALLAHKGGRRAEEAIATLLRRPERAARQSAVAALSRIDSDHARDILARHRAQERDPDVLKLFRRQP